MAADQLRSARERSGLALPQWAAAWGAKVGRWITPELVTEWERPAGSKPLMHWGLAAFEIARPAAPAVVEAWEPRGWSTGR